MTSEELKERIRGLAFEVVKDKKKADYAAAEYDELTKFPELKDILVGLLTADFDPFFIFNRLGSTKTYYIQNKFKKR